ncbi:MAG TPA: decaprenyl-phosphate phosphoribosyltransferase [Thermomicrobiales bacterium]|nr:decaprenyl-phosphate phosphoribosyltransferase [Thermomicrobiales bacterium]
MVLPSEARSSQDESGGTTEVHVRAGGGLKAWVRLLRPIQWTKNAIVFAALVFARLFDKPEAVVDSVLAFIAFCAISSTIYIFNDWRDIERDRHHPTKRARPLASGVIAPQAALVVAAVLAVGGCAIAAFVSWKLLAVCLAYLAMMVMYSVSWKHIVILDVFIIAGGFILRAVAGAAAVGVAVSSWLLLCTFFLSLFLGFCKRRNEISTLVGDAEAHRPSLRGYSIPVLDQFIALTAASTLMAYSMYTFVSAFVPQDDSMMLTIPFVAFAVARYLFLVYGRNLGGSPESVLLKDRPLFLSIFGWGITVLAILVNQM